MRTRNKLQEASHFLDLLKENQDSLREFQRYLSAFITAWRSVTFVLQSEYRHTKGNAFDQWYEEKIQQLSNLPSAKALIELRNIVQKQGNRLPVYQIEFYYNPGSSESVTITIEYDLSIKSVKQLSVQYKDGHSHPLPRPMSLDEIDEFLHEEFFPDTILPDFFEHLSKLIMMFSSLKRGPYSLIIDDNNQLVKMSDFLGILSLHLDTLGVIVNEAEELFDA